VISADITITMSQESFDRYGVNSKPGSALFLDADLVTSTSGASGVRIYCVPATKLAAEEFSKTLVANMIMLGAVAAVTGVVRLESLKRSVGEVAPKGWADVDIQALNRGFEWAKANLAVSSS